MLDNDHIHRLCGLRGCREPVIPGAFIEYTALRGDGRFGEVRVEVCAAHFDQVHMPVREGDCSISEASSR